MDKIKITDLNPIPLTLPERAILSRLGGNRHLTVIAPAEIARYRAWMLEALQAMRPRGRYAVCPIVRNDGEYLELAAGPVWRSAPLCALVGDAPLLWLGAVTLGGGVTELVAAAREDMARAVVCDAAGSECADQGMEILQQQAARTLSRRGYVLGLRRFSPGYGNLTLTVQREMFALLDLPALGMALTEPCIMLPEKSVTAVAPVFRREGGSAESK